jgi:hypothetical protein
MKSQVFETSVLCSHSDEEGAVWEGAFDLNLVKEGGHDWQDMSSAENVFAWRKVDKAVNTAT